ncbi:type VI secretion system-associated protein TagO [Acinetobacter baumannii]|uniref:type VI secretion system-associated protein TagO n=2 Tax=Acinetobacter baumannii TaxID=470 RepID=UPI0010FF2EEE|nr:type VI secretion system-associated protein TagO [Acinetobacter baumannii]MDI9703199.1 type VI secretion system-associated protein TagO [Acinetobacter baumannii]MDI9807306.1 type VI secretion system-associated protein TagO [Acinetobacter baumannii]MDV4266325.1 type VI secretion protein [Acinetobacter baumannii]TLT68099.1 hypothetical protein FD913_02795 [Acinetobacter baumannii]TLU09572.1 hypothetical protein FD890_12750 [Acinetobacter baumannii]
MKKFILVVGLLVLTGCSKEKVAEQGEIQAASEAQVSQNKWQYHHEKNPIDDSFTVLAYVESDEPLKLDGIQTRPSLVLRCQENKFDVYFALKNSVDSVGRDYKSSNITLRFDAEKAVDYSMRRGDDLQTLFFSNPIEMIDPLLKHDKLALKFTTTNKNVVFVSFDIRGLQYVISPLENACNLK